MDFFLSFFESQLKIKCFQNFALKKLSIGQKLNKETSSFRDIEHSEFRDVYIKVSYKICINYKCIIM